MKIKLKSSYKKASGIAGVPASDRFVYTVHGTEAELNEYRTAQGDFLQESETGDPLFFTSRAVENGLNLIQIQSGDNKGRYIADQSATTVALSTAKGYGSAVEAAVAKMVAERIFNTVNPTAKTVAAPVAEVTAENADLSKAE